MSTNEDQDGGKSQATAGRPIDIPGQPRSYQTQPAARTMPGSYAYTGGNAQTGNGAYGTPSSAAAVAGKGRRLVIGEGITMSGEIESCDFVLVEGTLEASLKGASVLEVAQSGVFYGTIEIDEATVSGRFEGDITVNGRLTVTATGSVTGSISYKELAVEAGATLDGKLSPLAAKGASASSGRKEKSGGSKAPARRQDSDDGSELPFASGNTAAA